MRHAMQAERTPTMPGTAPAPRFHGGGTITVEERRVPEPGPDIARVRLVRPDTESVYIAGAGPIGLGLLVMCAITLGPGVRIWISDVSPWRLEYARSFGAETVDARDPDELRRMANADVAFDSTGKQAARQSALAALGRRGVLVCAGHGEPLQLAVTEHLVAPARAGPGSAYVAV